MYNGEIIHFFGGLTAYIGELDQIEHPAGPGWWRIRHPCISESYKDDDDNLQTMVLRIWGDKKRYRKFVDIYCPPDSLMEIRVLDKNGGLYEDYMKELKRPTAKPGLIVAPSSAEVETINKPSVQV